MRTKIKIIKRMKTEIEKQKTKRTNCVFFSYKRKKKEKK